MRIALVNNRTDHLQELLELLDDYEVAILNPDDLASFTPEPDQVVILSGGHLHAVALSPNYYQAEIDLVRRTTQPVIGICLGFQILVYAYGGELLELPEKVMQLTTIYPTETFPVFAGQHTLEIIERHRWVAKVLPLELVPLATSFDGYEVVQHRDKLQFGLQFHPEIAEPTNDGAYFFFNLLKICSDQLARQTNS